MLSHFFFLAGDDPGLQLEFKANGAHIYRGHPAIHNFPTQNLKGGSAEINDRVYSIFQPETWL